VTSQLRKHTTDLSQGLSIGAHVSQDDQHMFLTLVGKELCCCQCQPRCDDTFNTTKADGHVRINTTTLHELGEAFCNVDKVTQRPIFL